uniref:Ankyrin repeat domain-containing protein n=1 Tax=Pinguiococcus pyrenoidosus TaxID=172671 RepID=A0A7R9Y972_9STRA|mmetsp:Transcript_11500/g.42935  ORF Transcript_11500/g.42935 Transcript_11500/m.42935 type:complete len:171 (+) Transcript_11500:152-664(+)
MRIALLLGLSLLRNGIFVRGQTTPLHLAAMENDVETATRLLRESPEIVHVLDVEDGSWVAPLYTAAEHGSLDVVRLLLANGADVDSETEDRSTPLMAACNYGDQGMALEIAKVLVEAGAHPTRRNKMRYNARKIAAERGYTKLYRYLRSLDVPPEHQRKAAAAGGATEDL